MDNNNNPISLSVEDMEELMGMIDTMITFATGYIAGKTGYLIDEDDETNEKMFQSMFEDYAVNGDGYSLMKLIDEKYLEGWVWLDE